MTRVKVIEQFIKLQKVKMATHILMIPHLRGLRGGVFFKSNTIGHPYSRIEGTVIVMPYFDGEF